MQIYGSGKIIVFSKLARMYQCNVFPASPAIYVADNNAQTNSITYDHEEKNNHRVMNELKVLSQHT